MLTVLLLTGACLQGQAKPPRAGDPPADADIVRHLPPPPPGIPGVFRVTRDRVGALKTKRLDVIDPPRLYPLFGVGRLHRVHWECVVHYRDTMTAILPVSPGLVLPVEVSVNRTHTIYTDTDQLER